MTRLKKHLLTASTAALLTIWLPSCSNTNSKSDAVDVTSSEAFAGVDSYEVAPRDSDLYLMGCRHADFITTIADDDDSIASHLLKVRACETRIRTSVDDDAARAYLAGFTRRLSEQAPEIARRIF